MSQALNTLLAALQFYQNHDQGEPSNRTDEIHELAVGPDDDISLDETGIAELMETLRQPCQHKREKQVGDTAEGMGHVIVYWCPDCGSLRKSMTNWKCTEYPREIPELLIQKVLP